jgi:hypothetical protein
MTKIKCQLSFCKSNMYSGSCSNSEIELEYFARVGEEHELLTCSKFEDERCVSEEEAKKHAPIISKMEREMKEA